MVIMVEVLFFMNYKIIFISFILLFFILGTASANDLDSTDVVGDNNVKEVYVNETGDDLNIGTQDNPYASIGKAISDVNASDDATIYLGEGTFSSDNDGDFDIDLNHRVYGGNLRFNGAGVNKTFIDGQSRFKFARLGQDTNITFKDITFINFKADNGATLYCEGILTIDSCVFKDSYATGTCGGAIYANGNISELYVTNSEFISCSVNGNPVYNHDYDGGGAICTNGIDSLYLENNSFISPRVNSRLKGSAINVYYDLENPYALSTYTKIYIKQNRFINITAENSFDASIFIYQVTFDNITSYIIDNTFINCHNPSDKYSTVYLRTGKYIFDNNTFINSTDSHGTIYLDSQTFIEGMKFNLINEVGDIGTSEIDNGVELSLNITDGMGNIINVYGDVKANFVSDDYNYSYIIKYTGEEFIPISFYQPPNPGNYSLTITFNKVDYYLCEISVVYDSNPVELWVSPNGFDGNSGTKDSPFKTIAHAIDAGFERSFNVIVNLCEGTYAGEGNVDLLIANKGFLQIVGERYDGVTIDGENEHWFLKSNSNVSIENVKFINGYCEEMDLLSIGNSKTDSLVLKSCIIDNNAVKNNYILNEVGFSNLTYTNNKGNIYCVRCNISDCIFENNTNPHGLGGVLYGANLVITNCRFINNSAGKGGAIYMRAQLTSINNYYENNRATEEGGAIHMFYNYDLISQNDTFINNHAADFGVIASWLPEDYYSFNYNQLPNLYIVNASFINNSAEKKAGALIIQRGDIIDSSFINNSANIGGAILVFQNTYLKSISSKINLNNVTFENNSAKNGIDIYLNDIKYSEDHTENYRYVIPLNITFNDLYTPHVSDYLTVNVYGPCGAVIGGSKVNFKLNGTIAGYCEIINSNAQFRYSGFLENGRYVLSGDVEDMYRTSTVRDGEITVNLTNFVYNREIWVSTDGSDIGGDGSKDNPFKTIQHAIDDSNNCLNAIIHIGSGTYAGELNTCLEVSSALNLTLIGESGTVIDGENLYRFIKVFEGKNEVVISNLTIKNMGSNTDDTSTPPIFVDANANLHLINVTITQCRNPIENKGNLKILNSTFSKDLGLISGGNIWIDNSRITSSVGNISGNVVISNSVIEDILSDSFELITGDNCTIENTLISNGCGPDDYIQWEIEYYPNSIKPALVIMSENVYMNNVSMENNFKGAIIEDYVKFKLAVFGFSDYQTERNILCLNSSFSNFNYIWCANTYGHLEFNMDKCVFNNFSMIAESQTPGEQSKFIISNSIFLNSSQLINRYNRDDREDPNCVFENNYWASNDKPVIHFINPGRATSFEPKSWIVLKNVGGMLKFQLTDGVSTTDYDGNLPLSIDYALDNGEMIPVITVDGKSYPLTFEGNDIRVDSTPIENPVLKPAADNTLITNDLTLTYGDIANFTARFLYPWGDPLANANVTFTIEGRNHTAITNADGIANIEISLNAGAYSIITVNPASGQTNINSIVVNKLQSVVSAANVNTVYNGGKYLIVTLKDSNGIALAGRDVTVVLNSKPIKGKTDANGQFKVSTNALAPKAYAAAISFAGDANHISSKAAATVKVTKATPKLTAKKATLKNKKYTITLKDNQNKAMKKVKVTLKVKGKTYKATTNAKGKATFKLTKLTKKGKYTAKVKFAGNKCYKAKSVKVKLTVK